MTRSPASRNDMVRTAVVRPSAAVAAGLAVMVGLQPLLAFNGQEHHRVSMDALWIARTFMEAEPTRPGWLASLSEGERYALDLLQTDGSSHYSFGDFVRYVDFSLDPLKLLTKDADITGYPHSYKDLNEDYLLRLRQRPSIHAWSSQSNDAHFQDELLMSWWNWHQHAVLTAAYGSFPAAADRDDRFFTGLLMSAIAAHFLEDFFAPGHIVPPREGMHDFSSLAMHDSYNRNGLCFELDPKEWKGLAGLAPAPDTPAWAELERRSELDRETLDRLLSKGPLPSTPACSAAAGDNPALELYGDGALLLGKDSDRDKEDQDDLRRAQAAQQRFVMTLVVARSIVDVLQSHRDGRPTSSFAGYRWENMQRTPDGNVQLAHGGLSFGHYVPQEVKRIRWGFVSMLDLSVQTLWEGRDEARGVVGLVVIPTWWAPPPGMKVNGIYVPRYAEPTLSAVVNYRLDEELDGFGGGLRLSVLFPRLDVHAGLGLGFERYSWDDQESWRLRSELRFGIGISFVTLHAGIGYDHALNEVRELDGSWAIRSGVTFGLPWHLLLPKRRG